ncbi:hypothetical protein BCR39DRAFT_505406 [Naematelia encephala]|uniref:Uncharacterized protein n=1 Tax=Naematelia encephala TaxID=71784 RepID=A0A1Y2B4R4_9TREE|nr:hypothetical protein BCR39DRAFT_505406 [Naematelia encephala]
MLNLTNYLAAQVDIKFDNDAQVQMVGGMNTGSLYSLTGHVSISLPALPLSLQGRLRVLRNLELIVEGKSEFFDEQGRYVPLRIYTDTITVIDPVSPVPIPDRDPARHSSRISLGMPFEIRLPGWLPPTHVSSMTSTSYGAIAAATIGWLVPGSSVASDIALSPLSGRSSKSPRRSTSSVNNPRTTRLLRPPPTPGRHFDSFLNNSVLDTSSYRASAEYTEIDIRRHRHPNAITPNASHAERHYSLRAEGSSASPIECIVSVPEWVDLNGPERSLKVSLRIRARSTARSGLARSEAVSGNQVTTESAVMADAEACGEEAQCSDAEEFDNRTETTPAAQSSSEVLVNLLELGMEVEESERYSSTPMQTFISSYPLPTAQPSRHSLQDQLISPRSPHADLIPTSTCIEDRPIRAIRTKPCLLAEDGTQRHFVFADEGLGLGERWRKVNVMLPMRENSATRCQSEMEGPFVRIKHALKIRVVCRAAPGAPETTVILTTPIRFGTCPSTCPSSSSSTSPDHIQLPAYVQLFRENGEQRECDPLPLYTPPTPLPTTPSPSPTSSSPTTLTSTTPIGSEIPFSPTPSYESLFPDCTVLYTSRSSTPGNDRMDIDSITSDEEVITEPSDPTTTSSITTKIRRGETTTTTAAILSTT